MKKISILFASIFVMINAFAITLPDGREVSVSDYKTAEDGRLTYVRLAMPVDFEVRLGNATHTITANKYSVGFHENGNVSYLSTGSKIQAEIGTGNSKKPTKVALTGNVSGKLEFHENGSIKEAWFPASEVPTISTEIGDIKLYSGSSIGFYDSGEIEFIRPSKSIDVDGRLFFKNDYIYFHKNGRLKKAKVEKEIKLSDALTVKPNSQIELHEAAFRLKSFIPLDGTTFKINGTNFLLATDIPVELNDDSSVKKIVVDSALKDISSSTILAKFSSVPDLKYVEVEFHKNNEIKSLRIVNRIDGAIKEYNNKFFNFTSNGGDFKSVASKVLFYDNGNIACEYHGEDVNDVVSGRVRGPENHMKSVSISDNVWGFSFLDYYDINGNLRLSMVYLIKNKILTTETALVEFDRDQNVVDTVEVELSLDCNLLFNDDLIPTGYTKIIRKQPPISVFDRSLSRSIYELGEQDLSQEIIERLGK